jgi:lipopolysaccharide/colanic/teichoic acid biosynthesis glycosyltransferase
MAYRNFLDTAVDGRDEAATGLAGSETWSSEAFEERGPVERTGNLEADAPVSLPRELRSLGSVRPEGRVERALRRGLDIVLSAGALVAFAPLLLAIAVLIKLDSPGPAIFKHQRVGINRRRLRNPHPAGHQGRARHGSGKPLTFYKFRTMYADARERYPELYSYAYDPEELDTLPIKVLFSTKQKPQAPDGEFRPEEVCEVDPRVTPIGRWLRRTSLDELPNLWNVLKGDLHLVGPRPDIEENIRYYHPHHRLKLDVKPGVTGLAQVRGRGMLTFHETNEFDTRYVEERSFAQDLKILFGTVLKVLGREGAY